MWEKFLISLSAIALWWLLRRCTRYQRMVDKFPGPFAYPIIGSAHSLGWNSTELHDNVTVLSNKYKWQPYKVWLGPLNSIIILDDPENFEIVLGSKISVDKGFLYKKLIPWLGRSLFICDAEKWRIRRKLLTPAYHIKLLENFVDTFNANAKILVRKLQKEVDGAAFDVSPYLAPCTLDIVLETAMGYKINAQNGSGVEILQAVQDQVDIFMKRSITPWLGPDFLFNLSSTKKVHDKSLKILNDITNKVIKTRREEMRKGKQLGCNNDQTEDGVKKRLVFIDLMLNEASLPGSEITDEIIREEVSTLLFAGFESSAATVCFTLWLLSWHQDIQDKVFQEIQEVFPERDDVLTPKILHEFRYLDQVIKESLRKFTIAPFISRKINEDLELADGKIAPKGCTLVVSIAAAHKNPHTYPDPEKFDPDRFLPENCVNRHPYAFLPFSAGPRNCIGQRQAMMEMKTIMVHVLHHFRILPGTETPTLALADEMVLVAKSGIPIRIVARDRAKSAI